MTYVSLHNHTEFSRLDGHTRIRSLAERAYELSMPAVAMTDHGNTFAARKLWKAAKEVGIKPIIGCEMYFAPQDARLKEKVTWGELDDGGRVRSYPGNYCHLTVLAQNDIGLKNLYRLQERGYKKGFYYEPRVDLNDLSEFHDGLIVLSGCAGSALSYRVRLGQMDKATELVRDFRNIFGDRYFIEIMDHGLDFEPELNAGLIKLAQENGIPLVPTNDIHYLNEEDAHIHDAMLCLQTKAQLADQNRFRFTGTGFYLKSYDEMLELFPAEQLANTVKIADLVESYDSVFNSRYLMPARGTRALREFKDAVWRGLERRGLTTKNARDRAAYEIAVIFKLKYDTYILAAADLVRFAKREGILVGPARGSAGGSLVCYALGITEINPLEYGLLFERFLNPKRISPPDLDIDFQEDRREDVIAYAQERYGERFVAQILTVGTEGAKSAVKDASRVLGRPPKTGQELANLVPPPKRGRAFHLKDVTEIKKRDPEVYDLAVGLEGSIRNFGVHAAGLIICPEPIGEIVPVKQGPKDFIQTAGFENEDLEAQGMIKIDVLGLTQLSTIAKTLEFIRSANEER